jgi:rRNA maturation RNase YbeY
MTRVLVLRNRQRTRALNAPLLRRVILHLLQKEFAVADHELGFHFVAADEMARINQQFLQHEGSTDVITFAHSNFGAPVSRPAGADGRQKRADLETGAPMLHGEIFISVPNAVKQARDFGTTWQSEIVRYIIHGLLHLRGFDDLQFKKRREMKREENRLLKCVESQFALRQLTRTRNSKLKTRNSP